MAPRPHLMRDGAYHMSRLSPSASLSGFSHLKASCRRTSSVSVSSSEGRFLRTSSALRAPTSREVTPACWRAQARADGGHRFAQVGGSCANLGQGREQFLLDAGFAMFGHGPLARIETRTGQPWGHFVCVGIAAGEDALGERTIADHPNAVGPAQAATQPARCLARPDCMAVDRLRTGPA